jgi:hypothetical protein
MFSLIFYAFHLISGCCNPATFEVLQDQCLISKYWEEMAAYREEIAVVFQLIMDTLEAERLQLQFDDDDNHFFSPSMRVDMALRHPTCLPLVSLVRSSL